MDWGWVESDVLALNATLVSLTDTALKFGVVLEIHSQNLLQALTVLVKSHKIALQIVHQLFLIPEKAVTVISQHMSLVQEWYERWQQYA